MRQESTERRDWVFDRDHPIRSTAEMLILETKGEESEQDRKHRYLDEWDRAVNAHGGFGHWRWALAQHPGEIREVLLQGREARTGG